MAKRFCAATNGTMCFCSVWFHLGLRTFYLIERRKKIKKSLSLVLALLICLRCVGCGSSTAGTDSNGQEVAAELPKNVQMYVPGATAETNFGSVTVMDAAFTTNKTAVVSDISGIGSVTLAPLKTKDVFVYIPCAKEVSTELDKYLSVVFTSNYSGYENFEFIIR